MSPIRSFNGAATLLALVHLVLFPLDSSAQEITRTNDVDAGARMISLGETYPGEPREVSAGLLNPASLLFLRRNAASVHTALSADGRRAQWNLAMPILTDPSNVTAIGLSLGAYGERWTAPSLRWRSFQLIAAKKIGTALSVGTVIDFCSGSAGENQLLMLAGTVGVQYVLGTGLSYGLVIRNLGGSLSYEHNDTVNTLRQRDGRRSIALTANYRYPYSLRRTVIELSAAFEREFAVRSISKRIGLEVWIVEFFCVRGGVLTSASASYARIGLGAVMGPIELDYAYAPSPASSRMHWITVSGILPF